MPAMFQSNWAPKVMPQTILILPNSFNNFNLNNMGPAQMNQGPPPPQMQGPPLQQMNQGPPPPQFNQGPPPPQFNQGPPPQQQFN